MTIFHFALPSPMTEAFARLPRGRVLQYHNVTPARYFAPYDPALFRLASHRAGTNWRRWSAASTWRSASPSTTGRNSRRWASRRPVSCRWPSTSSRITKPARRPALDKILDDDS